MPLDVQRHVQFQSDRTGYGGADCDPRGQGPHVFGLLEGFLPRLPGGVDQGWLPTVEQFDLHYLRGGTQVRSLRLLCAHLLTVLS